MAVRPGIELPHEDVSAEADILAGGEPEVRPCRSWRSRLLGATAAAVLFTLIPLPRRSLAYRASVWLTQDATSCYLVVLLSFALGALAIGAVFRRRK